MGSTSPSTPARATCPATSLGTAGRQRRAQHRLVDGELCCDLPCLIDNPWSATRPRTSAVLSPRPRCMVRGRSNALPAATAPESIGQRTVVNGCLRTALDYSMEGIREKCLNANGRGRGKKVQSSIVDIKIRQWYISKQRAISMVLKCTQVFQLYISKQVPLDVKELFP